jgi:hypothetical protein
MKLKSLLLGSAAVMVAVTGARAADAIIIEPEPVEYVRVCDAYGSGWWYIPGTEYCLKLDGEVRVQYDVLSYHDELNTDDETSYHDWDYRARLNVRARNETEYGTLASRIRFEANGGGDNHNDLVSNAEGPGDANAIVDWAVISLAGFRVGYADSYWATAGSYGYYNARYDGNYGFTTNLFFDYTYAANGWTATIGVADDNKSGEAGAPDVYGGLTYSGGGWYMAGIVYHDSSADNYAWKFRADYNFGNGFKFGGWYAADDGETDYVKGHYWGITSAMNLTDNMVLFGGYGAYDDTYNTSAATQGDYDTWTAGISWYVVPGLLIQPEYTATSYDYEDNADRRNNGRWSLRIVRSF